MKEILLLFLYFSVKEAMGAELKLTVYYESECGDSVQFITTQLYPTYVALGGYQNPYLEVDFVPYGKAETTRDKNGNYNFTCHHGPTECEGNKMQACALKYLPEKSTVEFITCAMNSTNPPEAGPKCAKDLSLDFSIVQDCLRTNGPELLANLGNRTHSLNPKLTWVPWVVYNSIFNEIDHRGSQANLLTVVCQKLATRDLKPKACQSQNGLSHAHLVQNKLFTVILLPLLLILAQ